MLRLGTIGEPAKVIILFLKAFQLFELVGSHAATLLAPAVVGLFCDTDLTNSVNALHALTG